MTHSVCVTWHNSFYIYDMLDMPHSMWVNDSNVMRDDMTYSVCVTWHDAFMCVTRHDLFYVCNSTLANVCMWSSTNTRLILRVWHGMTHSCVWHDTTHSMCIAPIHDSFICVTWQTHRLIYPMPRGGGLGSRPIFKKFHETYAPS